MLPTRCVHARGGERCSLYVDHYRVRKTGPRHAVAVAGCAVHRRGGRYTLYPPGHYPYGREAVAPCSASGELLRDASTGQAAWAATLFGAALDGARGLRWPSDSPWDDARRRRTQGRRLEFGARLLGVHPELDEGERERIATRLGVATLKLRDAAGAWARSWQARGAAIVAVLMVLPHEASLLDRLLAGGAEAGVWSRARRWDGARGTWIGARSRPVERCVVYGPPSRAPPPTTLRGAEYGEGPPSSPS